MGKRWEVIVREVVVQLYWVEAESRQDAIDSYNEGDLISQEQVESEAVSATLSTAIVP